MSTQAARRQERTDAELLYWAAELLKREQDAKTFGSITISLEGGRITRVKTERQETPAFTTPQER